jgi:uncharacterized membrane protein
MIRRESFIRLHASGRLIAMIIVGVAAALVTGFAGAWRYTPLIGWDASALTFTVTVWMAVAKMDAASTATHTNREDPGRAVTDLIVLIAAIASLAAVGAILAESHQDSQLEQSVVAGLALLSVALSWSTVHTLFGLRYARLYYLGEPGGLDFNQDERPRYLDFAYVAFTIGMTFQISDTAVRTGVIRATVLRHALLSYLFGAVVLAATINLVVGIATT